MYETKDHWKQKKYLSIKKEPMGSEISHAAFTSAGKQDMRQLGYFVEDGKVFGLKKVQIERYECFQCGKLNIKYHDKEIPNCVCECTPISVEAKEELHFFRLKYNEKTIFDFKEAIEADASIKSTSKFPNLTAILMKRDRELKK